MRTFVVFCPSPNCCLSLRQLVILIGNKEVLDVGKKGRFGRVERQLAVLRRSKETRNKCHYAKDNSNKDHREEGEGAHENINLNTLCVPGSRAESRDLTAAHKFHKMNQTEDMFREGKTVACNGHLGMHSEHSEQGINRPVSQLHGK